MSFVKDQLQMPFIRGICRDYQFLLSLKWVLELELNDFVTSWTQSLNLWLSSWGLIPLSIIANRFFLGMVVTSIRAKLFLPLLDKDIVSLSGWATARYKNGDRMNPHAFLLSISLDFLWLARVFKTNAHVEHSQLSNPTFWGHRLFY